MPSFYDALRTGDLDRAWQLLSDCAENALCVAGTSGTPRASAWDPSPPMLSRGGKSPERSASLRALLRLFSRVQVCLQRPFDVFLRDRIFRSLRGVRKLVPELPFANLIDDAFRQALQDLVDQYVQQENEAGRQRWRLRTRGNQGAARAYIKRRADQVLEHEKMLALRRLPANGCHPISLSPLRACGGLHLASRANCLGLTHGLPKLLLGSLSFGGSMPLGFGIKSWPCNALLLPGCGAKRVWFGKTTVKLAQLLYCLSSGALVPSC